MKILILFITLYLFTSQEISSDAFGNVLMGDSCRTCLIRKKAPAFTAKVKFYKNQNLKALLPNGEFGEISLGQYAGKYVVLFFYPRL
jgi:hypothetical protein